MQSTFPLLLSATIGLLSMSLLTSHVASAQNAAALKTRPKVVAYVPNWIDTQTFAATIDYDKITHINIAFENPTDDSGALSFNPNNQILIDQARTHKISIFVSIGGGAASGDKAMLARYFDLISPAKRVAFVTKLSNYLAEHNLDGLDVDLEGPSINADYGAFVAELAKQLKPTGKLLTSALSQGYGGKDVPDSVFAHFDWINIMAYDGAGPWDRDAPGQHSSMEYAKSSVDYWLKRGLAPSKAVLGVPFYGYGFGDAFRNYGYPYSEIIASFPGAEKLDQVGQTIWYNGIPTIQAKAQWAKEQGLGGLMIWSLDQDVKGEHSLLSALDETLRK